MEGIVTKSTGSWYSVRLEDGQSVQCRIKGKFRLDGIKHTNPVAVGDRVDFEMEAGRDTGVINKIHERKNYIIRKSSNLSKQTHIIASNLDQAALIISLVQPQTSLGFIDRFLLTAEAYHIPAILVFNKSDLYGGPMQELLEDTMSIYSDIGYTCLLTSAKTGDHIEELKEMLVDKTTLVSGHSGVGKSSLLNGIDPTLQLKTGVISNFTQKGMHTTTFAEMFALKAGGFIIDTPGIKEFGIVDIEEQEISHYFVEMRPFITQCKFNNCRHLNEPGCAVKKAVEEGVIREERYNSYLSILANEDIFE